MARNDVLGYEQVMRLQQKLRNPGERSSTLSFGGGFATAFKNSFWQEAKIPRKKRLFLFLFWTSKKGKKKRKK
jgi:hypothetical protein